MLHAVAKGKAETMTALHEYIFALRFMKFESLDGVNAERGIELAGKGVGNVKLEWLFGGLVVWLSGGLGVWLFGGLGVWSFGETIPAQLRETAGGNEIIKAFREKYFGTLVWSVTQFRKLTDNVVALGLLGLLMLTDDGARHLAAPVIDDEPIAVGRDFEGHRDGNLALAALRREQTLHLLVVVAIKTHASS